MKLVRQIYGFIPDTRTVNMLKFDSFSLHQGNYVSSRRTVRINMKKQKFPK